MIARVTNNLLRIEKSSMLMQGTVGETLSLNLPEEWSEFAVTAVFSAGSLTRDVIVTGSEITIPWELLTEAHRKLSLNFHAALPDGTIVQQTNITDLGTIQPSRQPSGNEPEAPSPSRADQIQALAEQALAMAQSVRDDADNGAFTGLTGKGIASIVKTATSGLVDIYTVTYTDDSTTTFSVTNGADGEITASSLANSFSASVRYSAGDHVIYNGRLYRFIVEHPAGIWIGSDAIPFSLANDVVALKSETEYGFSQNNLAAGLYLPPAQLFKKGDFSVGGINSAAKSVNAYRITNAETAQSAWHPIPCKKGDVLYIHADLSKSPYKGCRIGINEVGTSGFLYDSGWIQGVQDGIVYAITNDNTKGVNVCFCFSKTSAEVTTGGTETTDAIDLPTLFSQVVFSIRTGYLPSNLDLSNAFTGYSKEFTVPAASNTYKFPCVLLKGIEYSFTNSTSAAQTLNLYKPNGESKNLSTNMAAGATITFTPDSDDIYAVGGWYNGTGKSTLSCLGVGGLYSAVRANKAEAILMNNGRFSINAANRTISFATGMYLYTSGGRIELTASDVYSQISSYASYDSGTATVTVTLPYEAILAFNMGTHALKVCTRSQLLPNDVILFADYYQNDYGLLWAKYWRDTFIDCYKNGIVSAAEVFNAEPYSGSYNWQAPVVSYGALFKGKENVESFAFFTDPHVAGGADNQRNEANMANYCKRVQKVINATPCSFAVCGGDWLNNSTTMDEACYRLGYIKGIAKHLLDGCYLVNGNHDTNYQGKLNSSSENYSGRLTDATIAAIMYRDTDTKKAYYSFDGAAAKCYVLDTGIEHNDMTSYDWEQIAWLAGKLAEDDPEHAIIFLHIIMQSGSVQTNASNFASLVQAYNGHTSVTLNGVSYSFANCTGHVDFWMAGHTHEDSIGTLGGIPYIITGTNFYTSDAPLIDLVLVDYDAGIVRLVRAGGTGSNRSISF